jgi:hypothetical protein
MKSTNATEPHSGTETKPIANRMNRDSWLTPVVSLSARTGNTPLDVPAQTPTTITSVPDVGRKITELRNVLKLRKSKALTPYNSNHWHVLLSKFGLLKKYPFLPNNLRHGFDVGIPPIYATSAPNNSPSFNTYLQQYHNIVHKEFQSGRYIGPLTKEEVESLIGPFQSSPLSLNDTHTKNRKTG